MRGVLLHYIYNKINKKQAVQEATIEPNNLRVARDILDELNYIEGAVVNAIRHLTVRNYTYFGNYICPVTRRFFVSRYLLCTVVGIAFLL